jgi:serine/threonine protein kinase
MQDSVDTVMTFTREVPELASKDLSCEKIISDRRGAVVALLHGTGQRYALKFSNGDDQAAYDQLEAIKREGLILADLGDVADNLLVGAGEHDGKAWLLTAWVGEQTAGSIAKSYRENPHASEKIKQLAALADTLCAKVEQAHARGYLHGDLQPAHFVMPDASKAFLIDWALAHKIEGDDFQYKGSFIHYAAPEVAAQMLEKRGKVDYNLASEIYSMGAIIYFLATGNTVIDYGSDDQLAMPLHEKLKAVATSNFRSFEKCGAMEPVLRRALDPRSDARYPSIGALRADLAKLVLKSA